MKKYLSSANNFGLEVKPSDKSLILIRKNSGLSIDSWRTPTSTLAHDKSVPFKTILCFLWKRKSFANFRTSPEILFCSTL